MMLSTNQHFRVFSFDFSKAFDAVKHVTSLQIAGNICKWITDFFDQHYAIRQRMLDGRGSEGESHTKPKTALLRRQICIM